MGLFRFLKNLIQPPTVSREVIDPVGPHIKIITDSLNLLDTTTNPETYFGRCDLASNECIKIMGMPGAIYNGMNPFEIYTMLNSEPGRDIRHKQFIDRLFMSNKEDLLTYQLYKVGYCMSSDVKSYFVNRLAGKRYHFCTVSFGGSSTRNYTYVAKDRSIKIGDIVVVPTGKRGAVEMKAVKVTGTFDASLNEIDFPIDLLKCVESKYNA